MKLIQLSIFSFLISANSFSQELFLNNILSENGSPRYIEPTSPVLGSNFVLKLKENTKHPSDYFLEFKDNENLKNEILVSLKSYIETIEPGLDEYCKMDSISTLNREKLTEVEHAAIPLEVLKDFHSQYTVNLTKNILQGLDKNELNAMKNSLDETLKRFQSKKNLCGTALKIRTLEAKLENICLGLSFCKKALKINSIVSSAEAAFPRIQYSVNGYTRYVFSELLKYEDLEKSLKIVYDLHYEWLNNSELQGTKDSSLFNFIVESSNKKGIHPKLVLLILSYANRNMPSVDVEYGIDAEKALLLEIYFWSFKDIRNTIENKKFLGKIYPNYEFNPGIYHYLTASLLSCEMRLAGLGNNVAVSMGYLSKLGYKMDKLIKAIEKDKFLVQGFPYVKKIAQKQGFQTGLDSGEFGGKFGSKVCGDLYDLNMSNYKVAKAELEKSYSYEVKRGFRENNQSGEPEQVQLSKKDMVLHSEYLDKKEKLKSKFTKETWSLIND